jgi:hypothetical protein
MTTKIMYYCDGKGTNCQDHTNSPELQGWVKVRIADALHLYRWDYAGDDTLAKAGGELLHLCGAQCALKITSEFLERKKQ